MRSQCLIDDSSELKEQFRALAVEYQRYLNDGGVPTVAFRDPSLELFCRLPSPVQQKVVDAIRVSVEICRETLAQGHRPEKSPALTWQALKKFRFRPPSDFFSHIEDSTVVEIHSPEGLQIFRSFSFLKDCSYTLEELYCCEWTELFRRDDPKILEEIVRIQTAAFMGKIQGTVSFKHIPKHINREVRSAEKFVVEVGLDWGAPLFAENSSNCVATIVLETGRLLSKHEKIKPTRPHLALAPSLNP